MPNEPFTSGRRLDKDEDVYFLRDREVDLIFKALNALRDGGSAGEGEDALALMKAMAPVRYGEAHVPEELRERTLQDGADAADLNGADAANLDGPTRPT